MPGPAPKPAAQRRRRNTVAGARTLAAVPDQVKVPPLPKHLSHPMTKAWWKDIWASPMAPEFDPSDLHGLYLLADLVNCYWNEEASRGMTKKELAAEIRLQRQCFGLSPIDRRRLQWEIERGDQASEATQRRRTARRPRSVKDPRDEAI